MSDRPRACLRNRNCHIDKLRTVFRQPKIITGVWKMAQEHDADISEANARQALQSRR